MHDESTRRFTDLFQQGLTAARERRLDAAADCFDAAIALDPSHAAAHGNRATVLTELGQWDGALASYDRAIALQPDYAVAHANRAGVLRTLRRWDEALASCNDAIGINPALAEAWLTRGIVLRELGQLPAALASYDAAIALRDDYAEAFCNRGIVLIELQQVDAGLASYERAIAIRPDLAEAHYNRSTALLARGDFAAGWREFEWRWKLNQGHAGAFGPDGELQRHWLGTEPLTGKTLLLHSEQGFGDTLQFCRYAEMAAARGARVVLQVQEPLKRLLGSLAGVSEVVALGDAPPAFDYGCSLMSLPLAFETTLADVPSRVPYLACTQDLRRFWSDRLGATTKFRVGLVWSGGFRPSQPEVWSVNARRNIPLATLAPLAHPEIEFYSLQKGEAAEAELAGLVASGWAGPPLRDFTAQLHDFADTAALMEQLDLIISVDTSMIHLAGALGRPVWLLNRFDSCWRWLSDRVDSPWYPTLRMYRQSSAGDWGGVIEAVRLDLTRRLRDHRT